MTWQLALGLLIITIVVSAMLHGVRWLLYRAVFHRQYDMTARETAFTSFATYVILIGINYFGWGPTP